RVHPLTLDHRTDKVAQIVVVLDDEDLAASHTSFIPTSVGVHSLRPDSDCVPNLPPRVPPSTASGAVSGLQDEAEAHRDVGDLAVDMRSMVTPVIGYLELISQEVEP